MCQSVKKIKQKAAGYFCFIKIRNHSKRMKAWRTGQKKPPQEINKISASTCQENKSILGGSFCPCDSPLIFVCSYTALYNFLHLRNGHLVKTRRLYSLHMKNKKNRRAMKARKLSETLTGEKKKWNTALFFPRVKFTVTFPAIWYTCGEN